MKEIVNRLHEIRQIELAKSILESHGYKVEIPKKLNEALRDWEKNVSSFSDDVSYTRTIDGVRYSVEYNPYVDRYTIHLTIGDKKYEIDKDEIVDYGTPTWSKILAYVEKNYLGNEDAGGYDLKSHLQDILEYVEDNGDPNTFSDMSHNPEDYGLDEEYIKSVVSLLGSSNIYIYDSEDPGAPPSSFEPLQYKEFYKGTAEDLGQLNKSAGMGNDLVGTLITSKLGKVLQEGGYGVSGIMMTSSTRSNVIEYIEDMIKRGDTTLSEFLKRWSDDR